MKRGKILVFTLLVIISQNSFSADLWQLHRDIQSISSDFDQTKELKSMSLSLKSSGHMVFKRPDYFLWEILSPGQMKITFRGDMLEIQENKKEIKSTDLSKLDPKMLYGIVHLKAWMTLDRKFIEKNYSILEINKTNYRFTPKTDPKIFKDINVEFSPKGLVKRIDLTELSEDKVIFVFKNTKMTK